MPEPKDLWGAGVQVSAPECDHGASVGAKHLCVQSPAGCGKEGRQGSTGRHQLRFLFLPFWSGRLHAVTVWVVSQLLNLTCAVMFLLSGHRQQ